MKTRLFKWTLSMFILFSIFQTVHIVKADDDEYEIMKNREEHDDDDGDMKSIADMMTMRV